VLVRNRRCLFNHCRPRQQDVLANLRKGRLDLLLHGGPIVVKEECCAVVDQVELAMPQQQVGILRGAIHILREGIEPHRQRCFVRLG